MFYLILCPIRSDYYFDPISGWEDFFSFFSAAAFLAIPIGMFVFCWKNFVTNAAAPHAHASVLGLEDPPPLYADPLRHSIPQVAEEPGPSLWLVLLYLLTGLLTFTLGVLAFEAVQPFV